MILTYKYEKNCLLSTVIISAEYELSLLYYSIINFLRTCFGAHNVPLFHDKR